MKPTMMAHLPVYKSVPFVYCLFIALLVACSQKPNRDEAIFEALDQSLIRSTNDRNLSIEALYHELNDRPNDPLTAVKAKWWLPIASLIQKHSSEIQEYIADLKKELANEKTLSPKKVEELYASLLKYRTGILKADPKTVTLFDTTFLMMTHSFNLGAESQERFATTFFRNKSAAVQRSVLNVLHNNIASVQQQILLFYYRETAAPPVCEFISPIIAQNTMHVRPGEKIEITVGVGQFFNRYKEVITIDHKNVQRHPSGVSVYSFAASRRPGRHFVPVQVDYVDEEGKEQTVLKTVEYTVADAAANRSNE